MTASTGNVPGRIFMSYRREDTAFPAGWLYDRLAGHFGRDQVFKDIDSIELGDDFIEVITTAVGSCDVLLALIGGRWLTITGQDGRRRLDNPDDFVRLEIEAALARNVRVIPILVDEARMPTADELPASLAKLARRQALELSPARFEADTQRLLRVLDRTISEAQEQAHQDAERAARHRDTGTSRPALVARLRKYRWYSVGLRVGLALCIALFIFCMLVFAKATTTPGENTITIVGAVISGVGIIVGGFAAVRGR